MKTKILFRSLAVATLTVCSLLAQSPAQAAANENRGQLSSADYKFAVAATQANDSEVQLGQLAMQRATDPSVKQLAEHMVRDHSKVNQQLQQVLSQTGATVPTMTSSAENRELDRLQKLSGADFDKAYVEHVVKSHKRDIKEFEHAANNAQNADLKAFASNTLPGLQDHLKMAEDVKGTLKAEKHSS